LYPERYLFLEEAQGKAQTLCMDCCKEEGLVKTGSEKGNDETLFDLASE
jgi:hypothetical protein